MTININFSHSVVVSVAMLCMSKTDVVFIEAGEKVDGQYYFEKVLGQGLLSDIQDRCGHYRWMLQQDGTPSHVARNTVRYLKRENVQFIEPNMWPPNSPDLNPVCYAI